MAALLTIKICQKSGCLSMTNSKQFIYETIIAGFTLPVRQISGGWVSPTKGHLSPTHRRNRICGHRTLKTHRTYLVSSD